MLLITGATLSLTAARQAGAGGWVSRVTEKTRGGATIACGIRGGGRQDV